MIFYVFHSNSGILDSLKNAVSEHLEWLKFQKFSRSFTSKPTLGEGGGAYSILHTPQLYLAQPMVCMVPLIKNAVPFSMHLTLTLFSKICPGTILFFLTGQSFVPLILLNFQKFDILCACLIKKQKLKKRFIEKK